MDGRTMRTLAEYITELHRRDRHYNGSVGGSGFDTTLENHSSGNEGDRSGDGGCGQDSPGQGRDNIPG